VTAQVDGETQCWQERRLLVQSMASTRSAQAHLQERLQQAQHALQELTARRQGKPRLTTREEVEEAIQAVHKQFRVEGLLQVQIQEHVHERPVRAYRGRLSGVRRDLTFTLTWAREETAIAKAMSELGWRVYATNHLEHHLTLEQAVEAYRDEYLVERNFSRLKGHPLSLAPLYVQRDDHRIGLVRLLTLADAAFSRCWKASCGSAWASRRRSWLVSLLAIPNAGRLSPPPNVCWKPSGK